MEFLLIISGISALWLCGLSYLLATRFHKTIYKQILDLATNMNIVAQEKVYTVRVKKVGDDELGILVDGFNAMVAQLDSWGREVEEARTHAEIANRAKSEFLATMSHELRTPLNAVMGFSEIIKHETFGPVGSVKYREYANDIHESGQHLLSLINDILDLSKIESGTDELSEDKIEIPEVIRAALKLVGQPTADPRDY